MSKAIHWQLRFVSDNLTNPQYYRIDIYDEGYTGSPVQLDPGEQPFVTNEDSSEDFFAPIRPQTGTLQVCTEMPNGGTLRLEDILPENNIARPLRLLNITDPSNPVIEWQGFLSCEAYSQNYTEIPENLSLPVISVLEAMRSVPLSSYWMGQEGTKTVGGFISDIVVQIENDLEMQVSVEYSQASSDILSKYIFISQYFSYDTKEASGEYSYIYKAEMLYNIFEDICKFMGWCLREQGTTFYFTRIGSDELGMSSMNMANLEWMGTDHQRTIMQGAKRVSVEAKLEEFKTYFEMPTCPFSGLSGENIYKSGSPAWYYDKCTQTNVGMFTSTDITKCFLARFYGRMNNSSIPWNKLYADLGFSNSIYLVGKKYSDTSYSHLCTIHSVQDFSVICGVFGTYEDVGHFVLRIKEETQTGSGYIRCSLKFAGMYYSGVVGAMWSSNPTTFTLDMQNGQGELVIEIPRLRSVYTFATSQIELYLYDDFDIDNNTTAIISDISIDYEQPVVKDTEQASQNRYEQNLNTSRDEISVSLNLASSFYNRNALSHIYGVSTYWYGPERVDYYEPIKSLSYGLAGGTTESRRPEVDLLNRLAQYYSAARQRLSLIVAHPTAAPLPLLRLNGISPDNRTYLPLAESRDWLEDTCTLTCFETPN